MKGIGIPLELLGISELEQGRDYAAEQLLKLLLPPFLEVIYISEKQYSWSEDKLPHACGDAIR